MPEFTRDEWDDVVFPNSEYTSLPKIGDFIRIALQNHSVVKSGPLAHLEPSTIRLMGQVVTLPGTKGLHAPDAFALFIKDSPVPLRIIELNRVHSINGERVSTPAQSIPTPPPRLKRFKVSGSKGAEYIVECDPKGSWSCACVGFGYRRTCRHIGEAQAGRAQAA